MSDTEAFDGVALAILNVIEAGRTPTAVEVSPVVYRALEQWFHNRAAYSWPVAGHPTMLVAGVPITGHDDLDGDVVRVLA